MYWGEDEDAAVASNVEKLTDQSSGLDRLAESYFIGEQVSTDGVRRDLADCLKLMVVEVDGTLEQPFDASGSGLLPKPTTEEVEALFVKFPTFE